MLLHRVASQIPLRGPRGTSVRPMTECLHGAASDLDPCVLRQGDCAFLIGPIGPIAAARLGALFDPSLHGGSEVFRETPGFARSPLDREAADTLLVILPSPGGHRAPMDASILRNGLALAASAGHQHGLTALPKASVVGRLERVFSRCVLLLTQVDTTHWLSPLRDPS